MDEVFMFSFPVHSCQESVFAAGETLPARRRIGGRGNEEIWVSEELTKDGVSFPD